MRAVIDIGSNSVVLLAGEFVDGLFVQGKHSSRILGLSENLDENCNLGQEALDRLRETLRDFKEILEKIKISPSETKVVATEFARVALNLKEFFKDIEKELGFSIQIITGKEEAFYSALGVACGLREQGNQGQGRHVVLDMGGASTELIDFELNPFKIISSVSLPIGAVRATDWIKQDVFDQKIGDVLDDRYISNLDAVELICVGGTMMMFARIIKEHLFDEERDINGLEIDINKVKNFFDSFASLSEEEILVKYPFVGRRSWSIAAGVRALGRITACLRVKKLRFSIFGLRQGLIYQWD